MMLPLGPRVAVSNVSGPSGRVSRAGRRFSWYTTPARNGKRASATTAISQNPFGMRSDIGSSCGTRTSRTNVYYRAALEVSRGGERRALEDAELQLGRLRHAVLVPGRIPDDVHLHVGETRNLL